MKYTDEERTRLIPLLIKKFNEYVIDMDDHDLTLMAEEILNILQRES